MAPALLASAATPALFASFRAFWSEVDAARAEAVAAGMTVATEDAGLIPTGSAIQRRLIDILQTQLAEGDRTTQGAALQAYRDAHYLMAALADDVFVKLAWDGASWWVWNPMEAAVFGTRCAGQRIFERIDQLTANGDPTQRELAAVYLVALALGFEGQYAGEDDRRWRDRYRDKLRRFIFGDTQHLEGPIVPQCYTHTEGTARVSLLHSTRPWLWVALMLVAAWVAASTMVWRTATAPIEAPAQRIRTAVGGGLSAAGTTGAQP